MAERKMPSTNNSRRRHIPAELVEEILLHLPLKSVLRFSTVSKSWNSIIFGSGFVKRFRGRKRVVLKPKGFDNFSDASIFPLSSISSSSHNPLDDATPLVCPFKGRPYLLASCDELWCVEVRYWCSVKLEVETSLILWNHSLRTYRKLPNASFRSWWRYLGSPYFSYGLGYDSVGDDYKILKIHDGGEDEGKAELYSLRSDSWRMIQPFPRINISKSALFVSGALHWIVGAGWESSFIISFDLSTEKYGEVAMPEFDLINYNLDTTVSRGKLCVYANNFKRARFVLWVMEDYESGKSWTKELDINYLHILPRALRNYWRPFYFYDDGQNLNKAVISFIDEDSTLVLKNVCHTSIPNVKLFNSFMYVESLVSPDRWP